MGGSRSQQRRKSRGAHSSRRAPRDRQPGPAKPPLKELCELSPFSLFCALHLGIAQNESYAPANADTISRRFGLSEAEFKHYLDSEGLTEEDLHRAGFDLESARFDIEVAPPGISRTELARTLFSEFCALRDAKPTSQAALPGDR
ncbi:MAG: hypothetical protein E2O73_06540 [Deltaproteobacteria bacterium]|nr:MAG: hypothetical protein E2O73_06540 [Deltaproteobacteria bacterium]